MVAFLAKLIIVTALSGLVLSATGLLAYVIIGGILTVVIFGLILTAELHLRVTTASKPNLLWVFAWALLSVVLGIFWPIGPIAVAWAKGAHRWREDDENDFDDEAETSEYPGQHDDTNRKVVS